MTFQALYQHRVDSYHNVDNIIDWKVKYAEENSNISGHPIYKVSVKLQNQTWHHALFVSKFTGWGYRIVDECTGEIVEEFDEWDEYWNEPDAP